MGLYGPGAASIDAAQLATSIPIGLGSFSIVTGTPAITVASSLAFRAFDADADEDITTTFFVPQDYAADGALHFHWSMASATGESIAATALSNSNLTVPGTAGELSSVTGPVTPTSVAAGDAMTFRIGREGSHGTDSATGDMRLHAVEFRYTRAVAA